MWPRVGVRKCVSRLKHVVLPAPLGPISAWIVPRRTARLTSLTATKPLNSFVSARVSSIVSSAIRRAGASGASPSPKPWAAIMRNARANGNGNHRGIASEGAADRSPRRGLLVFDAREIGLLRSFARFAEGPDALLGEERDHPQKHFRRHHGVAERRVPA